jgi:hypothetical protein
MVRIALEISDDAIYIYLMLFSWFIISILMDGSVQPESKAIKKRIEDLITRDYLERDKENPNVFRYLP